MELIKTHVRLNWKVLVIVFLSLQCLSLALDNVGKDPTCQFDVEFNFDLCINASTDYFCTVDNATQRWLHSLYREATDGVSGPLRKRREIRTLSETERWTFFNALNELKRDTSIKPNKYDALVLTHTNRTICSAHVGSNFFGWHRIYILLLETALRQIDNSVTIPYWDWLIDNSDIILPKDTILFTKQFLGNGDGAVTSGPFKGWKDMYGCPLMRDIAGENTTLPSHEIIATMIYSHTVKYVEDITDGGRVYKENISMTLEGQHNLVHDWIGRMMHILDHAPKDPVFFLHHSYVDYLWEKFRLKQMTLGIDPETDYPGIADEDLKLSKLQGRNRTMDCFFWMANIDGYSNSFTQRIYTYEDPPTCPDCGNSSFLACNKELQRCVGINENMATSAANKRFNSALPPCFVLLFLWFIKSVCT